MSSLLTLSPERIAAELTNVAARTSADRRWRRTRWLLGVRCGAWYAAGLGLMGGALHTTDYAFAETLFHVGQFVATIGPVGTLFLFWRREEH
jgi:hypothetical protein